MIEGFNEEELENFAVALHSKFLQEAGRVATLTVEIAEEVDPIHLFDLCFQLITRAPDAGNTPQRITGLLLKNYHESFETGIVVTGYDDRASVTSTTSKKPGDINEEAADGEILKVYEVTVKTFNEDRIRDSYDTVSIYNDANDIEIKEVTVICRIEDCPFDVEYPGFFLGRYEYEDMLYYFIDIFEWIISILLNLTESGRESFYNELNDYINEVNTSETVKNLWIELHEE